VAQRGSSGSTVESTPIATLTHGNGEPAPAMWSERYILSNEKRPDQARSPRSELDARAVRSQRKAEHERRELAATRHFAHDAGSERELVDPSADTVPSEPKAPVLWGRFLAEW